LFKQQFSLTATANRALQWKSLLYKPGLHYKLTSSALTLKVTLKLVATYTIHLKQMKNTKRVTPADLKNKIEKKGYIQGGFSGKICLDIN
jgi:hypothetical protein